MSIEDVLSDIVGVPCGNIDFTLEADSLRLKQGGKYSFHPGLLNTYLTFETLEPLKKDQYGSLRIRTINNFLCRYSATLLHGEETSKIVQAVAESLRCE